MVVAEREWVSVREFADRHRLSRNYLYELAKAGRILSLKLGGKVLIASDALDVLAEGRADGAGK